MVTGSDIQAHGYLFLAGIILVMIFIVYIYICNHKVSLQDDWRFEFIKLGLNADEITHDDNMWYFRDLPTCVLFGRHMKDECPRYEGHCAGGENYGTFKKQALAVKEAVHNGGEHPLCPLIYPGAP